MLHFSISALVAGGFEALVKSVAGAADAALVTGEDGQGEAGFGSADLGRVSDVRLAAADSQVEQGGLDGGEAQQTPAGDDELVEEMEVVGVSGWK